MLVCTCQSTCIYFANKTSPLQVYVTTAAMTKETGFRQKIEGWGDNTNNWKYLKFSQKHRSWGFFPPLYSPLAQTRRSPRRADSLNSAD